MHSSVFINLTVFIKLGVRSDQVSVLEDVLKVFVLATLQGVF